MAVFPNTIGWITKYAGYESIAASKWQLCFIITFTNIIDMGTAKTLLEN